MNQTKRKENSEQRNLKSSQAAMKCDATKYRETFVSPHTYTQPDNTVQTRSIID